MATLTSINSREGGKKMRRRILYGVSFFSALILVISLIMQLFIEDSARATLATKDTSRPHYQITAKYDKDRNEVCGQITILLPKVRNEPQKEVYFHLYPNAFKNWIYTKESKPTSPGYLNVSNVKVNHTAVKEVVQGTMMKIILPTPIINGQSANIQMNYTLHLPHGGTRLNQFKNTAFLAQWYPMLVVKDNEGWHKDPYTTVGDPFYTVMSDFDVTFQIPRGYNVISTSDDSKQVWNRSTNEVKLRQDNVRDFAAVLTRDYKVVRGQSGDVQVNLWYVDGMEDVSKPLLNAAVSGMSYFGQLFGKYPYHEVDVVLGETGYGIAGMEYPGLVTSVCKVPSRLGMTPAVNVVVHELAHQWWYGVVGNNQVKEPWLDEGLTTFSEFLYMQEKMKQDERELLKRAAAKTNEIHQATGLTSGESLYKYPDEVYGLLVYIRPAAMMYNLMDKIGREKVLQIMRSYYQQYQFRVATSNDFFRVANKVSGQDLTSFFKKWVYFK